jgi:hypothetical protein
MKNKLAGFGRDLQGAFKTPHTVRSAKRNVWVWSICSLMAAVNIAMNVQLQAPLMWVWLAINVVTLFFDATVLRWSVIGYFWRKDLDAQAAKWQTLVEQYNRP